jgi:uncharacterized protein (TIGR03435 family)
MTGSGVLVLGGTVRFVSMVVLTCCTAVALHGQASAPTFDVVSIKRSDPAAQGGSARTLPDGTTVITNQPLRIIFVRGVSEPVRDIENVPDWAMDFYDVTVKPPNGADRSLIPAMWRAMLEDRLKFRGHIERREKDGGRGGPDLLTCSATSSSSKTDPRSRNCQKLSHSV